MTKRTIILSCLLVALIGYGTSLLKLNQLSTTTQAAQEQRLDVGFSRFVRTQQEALEASVLVEYGMVTGSGFVINTFLDETESLRGYTVITAAHVLKPEHRGVDFFAPIIRFTKRGVRMFFHAEVTWIDTDLDLAILTAWGQTPFQICLPFGIVDNDDYLQYAKDVYLVSFPQGYGPMMTEGIISGISILDWDTEAYTTTAQAAPGSSGGAVIDLNTGEVLGFLKAIVTVPGSPQFLGWQAIVGPASDIRRVVALSNQDEIIPAGPRGAQQGIIFTPTQAPKVPPEKK